MWDWNSGSCPLRTRSRLISISGRMNPSSLSSGQWSVCRASVTSTCSATTWAISAIAVAPMTMSLDQPPAKYAAPPVETWMMPSEPASAKPLMAALSVCDEVTLIAG